MRKRSDTDPAPRGPETQIGAGKQEPQSGAREPEVRPDAMKPEPAARYPEPRPGAGIRERTEEDREGRGRRVVCYLRRHAWAVARLLCGTGALAVLGTLRGEVPLLFALLALWGAGELLYGALRRRK